MATVVGTITAVVVVTPWFLVALVPIVVLYTNSQRFFINTSREIQRLDSMSRSPVYAHFSETLAGVETVRAYGKQSKFIAVNQRSLDKNQAAYFLKVTANCWLAIRLEFAATAIITFATLCSVLQHPSDDPNFPGLAALSISTALGVTQVPDAHARAV
jgi:ATP-binding cassette subfamily C (CFTR/MRP) protein 1